MKNLLGLFALTLLCSSSYSLDAQCIMGNCMNGYGKFKSDDGAVYEGEFVEGQRQGQGTYYYINGDVYRGEWANGLPNGQGIRYLKDGSAIGGQWAKGRLIDQSINVAKPSKCLKGNCQDGYGELRDASGNLYKGEFKAGQREGKGRMSFKNGDRYVGNWKNGLPHGKGMRYYSSGHVDSGEWIRGQFAEDKVRTWALIVGISDYSAMPKLRFTAKDANRVHGFLRSPQGGAVPESQIEVLLEEEATLFNIQNKLADLCEKADSTDLVLFYFAGHGKKGAFLPYDYDGQQNQLYHVMIRTFFSDSDAKVALCVADACHSGSLLEAGLDSTMLARMGQGRSLSARDIISKYYSAFKDISQERAEAYLLSSAKEEVSLEAEGLEQGVFTYYFLEGLGGKADINKDKIVTINELFNYVQNKVRKFSLSFQIPIKGGDYDAQTPIGVVRE